MHFTSEKYGKVITQINLGHINGVNFFWQFEWTINDELLLLLCCYFFTSAVNNYGHAGRSVNLTTIFLGRLTV